MYHVQIDQAWKIWNCVGNISTEVVLTQNPGRMITEMAIPYEETI